MKENFVLYVQKSDQSCRIAIGQLKERNVKVLAQKEVDEWLGRGKEGNQAVLDYTVAEIKKKLGSEIDLEGGTLLVDPELRNQARLIGCKHEVMMDNALWERVIENLTRDERSRLKEWVASPEGQISVEKVRDSIEERERTLTKTFNSKSARVATYLELALNYQWAEKMNGEGT